MMKKVFIDGSAGTTGLQIFDRLSKRNDIQLIVLEENVRKDPAHRKAALNSADIAFLCLPDDAAREAIAMLDNPDTVILDTSTAHRTNPAWCYGFPEIFKQGEEKVASSKRIAVPGCHACGFIALIRPLIDAGIIKKEAKLTCTSLTGFSGGGKKMIAEYADPDELLKAPRQYGITQNHKHLKEMMAITGLERAPIFHPIVADFYSGMEVSVGLFAEDLNGSVEDIKAVYQKKYKGEVVYYKESADENGFLSAGAKSRMDSMEISVHGNDERILLCARYDNLGKGASGAAVECMNLVLGADKLEGLKI